MDILFSVTAFPGITDPVIFRAYETTAPNTLVAASDMYATPHTSARNIVIAGVNPVPHIIKAYRVPGGIGTGTLLKDFWFDPTFLNVTGEKVLFFEADRGNIYDPLNPISVTDPASGTNSFSHPLLAGLSVNDFTFERRGRGTLTPDELVKVDADEDFSLALIGDQWEPGEVGIIRIPANITTATPTPGFVSMFSDIAVISVDTQLDTTYARKLISAEPNSGAITITLDALANVPDNSIIPFITHLGNLFGVTIKASGSENIKFNKADVNKVYMGAGEELWITKKDIDWYVIKAPSGMLEVGQIISAHMELPNTLKLEGQALLRADYPRLWNYIQSLPSDSVVTDTLWSTSQTITKSNTPGDIGYGLPADITIYDKKGCFSTGDGSTTFRLPDLRGQFICGLKDTDAERYYNYAGGLQAANVGPHEHAIAIRADNTSIAYNYRTVTTRPVEDILGGAGNYNVVHLTDKAVGNTTRSDNAGLYFLIKI